MNILISGSSGFIGAALTGHLRQCGHSITRLVRRKPATADEFHWDPDAASLDSAAFNDVDAVIHLAGVNIAAKRWTPSTQKEILSSRIKSTNLLCISMSALKHPPRTLVCASGAGYYGDFGSTPVDETFPCGSGFLAGVSMHWEAATEPASRAGIRVVNTRLGMVLGQEGGALAKMILPFKLGLGCIIGSGDQYVSWITIDDVSHAVNHILTNQTISGPANLVSPNPVTNREFSTTLGSVLHRPVFLKAPAALLRLALGPMADDLLLTSTRAIPAKLQQSGYKFLHPTLPQALKHVLKIP